MWATNEGAVMGIEIPPFGTDMTRVSAYALFTEGWHVYRVFLPLPTRLGEIHLSWADLAEQAGTVLGPQTTLLELLPRGVDLVAEPEARAGHGFIPALLEALTNHTDIFEPHVIVRWTGYAESGDADEVALRGSHLGPWQMREFAATLEPLTDLIHVEHSGLHLPTHVWSLNRSLVITCPMFFDSLYISSPTLTGEELAAAGLEAVLVPTDSPLPIAGD
ncbi:MAG: hypothetical protein Q4P33_04355 [Flaviflexus sp.]|nr:hypothetical protein [Flaviflexus sp.]